MPRRCCVPGCTSNYDTCVKKGDKCVTTFKIPNIVERRLKWIQAIPRGNWVPSSSSVVCSKHFQDSDVISHYKSVFPDGTVGELPLRCPQLKDDAVPRIFP